MHSKTFNVYDVDLLEGMIVKKKHDSKACKSDIITAERIGS